MIDNLKELLHRRPFTPFQVILSSGDRFDVRHPEFAWLVKGGLYVGLPAGPDSGGSANGASLPDLPERVVFCSALHLTGIVELAVA
jgi:hypothetical protein